MNGRFPVIHLEIEGVRDQMIHAIMLHEHEIIEAVSESVKRVLSPAYIQQAIDELVDQAFREHIKNIAGSFRVREAIEDLVVKAIESKK